MIQNNIVECIINSTYDWNGCYKCLDSGFCPEIGFIYKQPPLHQPMKKVVLIHCLANNQPKSIFTFSSDMVSY